MFLTDLTMTMKITEFRFFKFLSENFGDDYVATGVSGEGGSTV